MADKNTEVFSISTSDNKLQIAVIHKDHKCYEKIRKIILLQKCASYIYEKTDICANCNNVSENTMLGFNSPITIFKSVKSFPHLLCQI